jgi:hypothetical protein
MFADDLMLMGQASIEEANVFLQSLLMFAQASGQRVGPAKFKLCFSKVTPQFMQFHIR